MEPYNKKKIYKENKKRYKGEEEYYKRGIKGNINDVVMYDNFSRNRKNKDDQIYDVPMYNNKINSKYYNEGNKIFYDHIHNNFDHTAKQNYYYDYDHHQHQYHYYDCDQNYEYRYNDNDANDYMKKKETYVVHKNYEPNEKYEDTNSFISAEKRKIVEKSKTSVGTLENYFHKDKKHSNIELPTGNLSKEQYLRAHTSSYLEKGNENKREKYNDSFLLKNENIQCGTNKDNTYYNSNIVDLINMNYLNGYGNEANMNGNENGNANENTNAHEQFRIKGNDNLYDHANYHQEVEEVEYNQNRYTSQGSKFREYHRENDGKDSPPYKRSSSNNDNNVNAFPPPFIYDTKYKYEQKINYDKGIDKRISENAKRRNYSNDVNYDTPFRKANTNYENYKFTSDIHNENYDNCCIMHSDGARIGRNTNYIGTYNNAVVYRHADVQSYVWGNEGRNGHANFDKRENNTEQISSSRGNSRGNNRSKNRSSNISSVSVSSNNNEILYDMCREHLDTLGKEKNTQVLSKIMDVMMNIQNDLKDVKHKLTKKKKKELNENENENIDKETEKRNNNESCIKGDNMSSKHQSKKCLTFLKEENKVDEGRKDVALDAYSKDGRSIDKESKETKFGSDGSTTPNNGCKEDKGTKEKDTYEKNVNEKGTYEKGKILTKGFSKNGVNDIDKALENNKNHFSEKQREESIDQRKRNINNFTINKELCTSFNLVLKNLNYENIDDSVICKSNRLYLFNKFFTSLFYKDSTRTHNFIMFNIYNIEQKRQTHKVSLFQEKDYYDMFHLAYNNLLFYAFDCYKFYRHIKNKFKDTYKIYENSTMCLYINNNYETNLINRIFIEQNNYNNNVYHLNEKRILKTSTKYFLDHFLSLIDKKINIKNIIPLMKKSNYELDQNNLYFFISTFNLMDKIFSDSNGFDCNKKIFEKNSPNVKNFAIFFKFINDASNFYDSFISGTNANNSGNISTNANNNPNDIPNDNTNGSEVHRGCYRLIIVALHKGKSFKYNKLSFSSFMKTRDNELHKYYNNYDSMSFENNTVILFNLSYAVPFYYVEYYKN
ncbi:conserved Plasmodium protein, unknown function [Plasmodium malariae]|nr:conserved Plasmodium protein, unknown function [Plasmodium malariae]